MQVVRLYTGADIVAIPQERLFVVDPAMPQAEVVRLLKRALPGESTCRIITAVHSAPRGKCA